MKKQLLALSLVMMSIGLFSQSTVWKPYNSNFDTTSGCRWLSVVDSNSVWAIKSNGTHPTAVTNKFTRTQNGSTFIPGLFLPDTLYYSSASIKGVNDSVAFIPCYSKDGSRAGVIMKTMDRGLTWTNVADTSFMFTTSANFPDWIHFYDNNHGIVMGDPNGGNYEMYITYNGGTNWTRVPNANIPPPVGTEYGITDCFTSYGKKHMWFGTAHAASAVNHVMRSSDTGHTWQSATVPGMNGGVSGLAFRDSLNGMCWGTSLSTGGKTVVKRTSNGGITWTTVNQRAYMGLYDICVVPGRNAYMSVGLDSVSLASAGVVANGIKTSVTYDDGDSWSILESAPGGAGANAFVMLKVQMVDSSHGWAGSFSNNTLPLGNGGMNKWIGPVIPYSCPLSVTGNTVVCSGNAVTLTANGGAATYTWSPLGVNTNTVSVSPSTTTIYTVNSSVAGCTNSKAFTLSVTPTPTVAVTSSLSNDTICAGTTSTTLNATGVATSYSWTPIASITGTGASVIAHPTVTTTYTLTGHTGACIGTKTITIVLSTAATPTVGVTSSVANDTICSGSSTSLTGSGAANYTWSPASTLSSSTGTSVIASPTVATTYTVYGHAGTCIGTKTITIVALNCVGINQLTVNGTQVSFYPNPSNGQISVNLTNVKAGTALTVSDLLGNEVYKTSLNSATMNQNLNIDLSSLPKGVYLFGVSNGSQLKVQKLVIQ